METCSHDLCHQALQLTSMPHVTVCEVHKMISSMTSAPMDYVPTSLVKACPAIFAELITYLANLSFSEGCFPQQLKKAQVMPLLKREGLDKDTPANYRPISNLNTVSKITERLILVRFRQHLTSSPSVNSAQSAYRRHHSTEMALLRTMDAVYRAADRGEATLIVVLDISAALDTIDHTILLNRLNSFGAGGNVLSLISSYLAMRSQTVRVGSASLAPSDCSCGVPQGSVLGPILFTVYMSPIASVAYRHHMNQQQYTDDAHLYIAFTKQTAVSSIHNLQACLIALQAWFAQNGLALNPDKTEVIQMSTIRRAKELHASISQEQASNTRSTKAARSNTQCRFHFRYANQERQQGVLLSHPGPATHSTIAN